MPSTISAGTTAGTAIAITGDTTGNLAFQTNGTTTAMTIDTSQNVGIGVTSPGSKLQVAGTVTASSNITISDSTLNTPRALVLSANRNSSGTLGTIRFGNTQFNNNEASIVAESDGALDAARITFNVAPTGGSLTERMRIDSSGNVMVAKTTLGSSSVGCELRASGLGVFTASAPASGVFIINRNTDDGTLIDFRQDNTLEGTITVSGTTVSYNGGHLARWSQLPNNQKDDTLLKGTVMSNLDDMCVWTKDGEVLPNEQLNKMKVSDVEGDTNVAGVFVNWTRDEDCNSDDMNVAMTGDMIIRIAQNVVVQKGDLLISAGDGTAKPQGDDIRRSKTVAKVTSNRVTCTYADGSYCVPCVLMAC